MIPVTKHTEQIKIYNHYTNYKGRLFIKTLCDLFNDVAERQTETLGVDVNTLNKQGQTWMLHRLHIQIFKMPHKEETVILETWPSGIERLFALRDYRMLRQDGEVLVNATSEWMLIDLKRRRPLRQTQEIVEMSTGHRIEKITLPPLLQEKERMLRMTEGRLFPATFDNIDFNGHVTQASYMRWLTNSLPFDFLRNHILTEVEVVYEHEIMPDTDIYSYYQIEQEGEEIVIAHQIKDETGEKLHCVAKSVWKPHADSKFAEE
ncbi:acyl-[acyl-carrier-protein] thioesterase [Odoribacter lunatus]|uniref:acyl-[acyl-carrier-protein] thioesterase n=1 Tax=Odoribacter lunatus TaxID=2941335 RepID=UPI0020415A3E|nr:acyl-ACP thioesterase domain-containing protein [Odoribacter lunatus]